jgi:MFS family permease
MVAGWILYAVVYLGFSATSELVPLLVLFLVYGLYFGLIEPVERAWVAGLAPPARRGAAFGWYHAAVGFAALPLRCCLVPSTPRSGQVSLLASALHWRQRQPSC